MNLNQKRVLALDIELQCWPDLAPNGFHNDIIQIGLVELDLKRLVTTRARAFYVRPDRLEISPFCTELTGITEEVVKREGRRFREVMQTIANEYGPAKKVALTWGDDQVALDQACREAEIENPFRCINLGWLFRSVFQVDRNLSVEQALKFLGLTFEGIPHNASTDALNTSRIYAEILRRQRAFEDMRRVMQPA